MLGTILQHKNVKKNVKFHVIDIDSNLQTNDSRWLDSFCDLTLIRPSHDSDSTRKIFR